MKPNTTTNIRMFLLMCILAVVMLGPVPVDTVPSDDPTLTSPWIAMS